MLSRKMSFIEQPIEIIIEQLRYLPIQDLLNACQTNPRIAAICQGRDLWALRLQDQFKVEDLSKIEDPRSYFFSLVRKRESILFFILETITRKYYESHQDNFALEYEMHFSYNGFIAVQLNQVMRLTERQIKNLTTMIEFIRTGDCNFFHAGIYGPEAVSGFFFSQDGRINLTSTII
jgi:hypothetical protein